MQRRLNLNFPRAFLLTGFLALFGSAAWLWLRPSQVLMRWVLPAWACLPERRIRVMSSLDAKVPVTATILNER